MAACGGSAAADTDPEMGTTGSSGAASASSTASSDTATSSSGGETPTTTTQGSGSTDAAPSTDSSSEGPTSSDVATTGDSSTSSETEGASADPTTDSGSSNTAPVLLSTSINPASLAGAGSVTITVVATDPDGIDDLIGGTVSTPDGVSYGALVSAADEGAYSFEIDWDLLHTTASIEIPPNETELRPLTVTVFDQAGESVSEDLEVILEATQPGLGVCDGASVSLQTSSYCGSCDFSCNDPLGSTLGPGACVAAPECYKWGFTAPSTADTNCLQACIAAAGPQAETVDVLACQFSSVSGVDCDPNPSSCAALSINNPPPGCFTSSETLMSCECGGSYYPKFP